MTKKNPEDTSLGDRDLVTLVRRARDVVKQRNLAYIALEQSFAKVETLLAEHYPTRVSAIELEDRDNVALLYWKKRLWILQDNDRLVPLMNAPSMLRLAAANALSGLVDGLQDDVEA